MFKTVLKHCPWILRKSPLGVKNRWLGILYERELQSGYTANVAIKWIDDSFGYGLFAEDDLPAMTFVGVYTGVIRRRFRLHPNHNAYCFHYPSGFWRWKVFMIDAENKGNYTRFINHSDKPNLKPVCVVNRGLLHIVFLTNQHVVKGAQLTFNYGSDYWRKRKKLKSI
jgi:SET domain-containing protein